MKKNPEDATVRIHVPPTERIASASLPQDPNTATPQSTNVDTSIPRSDRLFDHYAIYSKIGDGGMGVVYLARDKRLDRFVAIKRLNIQAQAIPALRQRFLCEARAVAALSHVHIIHIYALGEDDDGPYIVMEYIAGPDDPEIQKEPLVGGLSKPNAPLTLDQYVAKHGQYTLDDAVTLVTKIAKAVTYAHTSGVIHRDLKPSNILLDKTNEPKIVDFGLARLMHKGESDITVAGEKLLSLGYGAPEQETDARQSDERADVYGLGGLLYFLLTGQNPRYFREQDIPVQIREVALKALATDKEQRWQSAQAFIDALTQARERTKIEMPTVKTTWRCKWCDAINPLTLKYCAECGWDGSEACPECGADSFIGVQYCGNCGADTRAYETLTTILKKMRESSEQHRFERANLYAGRIHGFEPAGPTGRQLLNEMGSLREKAEKSIRKRNQLKEQIPMEIRAENFERAAIFIKQYRELSEEQYAFLAEEQNLPELILLRDIERLNQTIRHHDWTTATRIYAELIRTPGASNNHELLSLGRRIKLHRIHKRVHTGATIAFTAFILYLALLPLFARQFKDTARTTPYHIARLGIWFYERSLLAAPLQHYAHNWLGANSTVRSCLTSAIASTEDFSDYSSVVQSAEFVAFEQKKNEYVHQLDSLMTAQSTALRTWSQDYLRELDVLMERRRTAGDFDGWASAQEERKQFEENNKIDEPTNESPEDITDLRLLKSKYRQRSEEQRMLHNRRIITLCKKYISELTDLQRNYMQSGKMDIASAINTEIRRVRALPQYSEVEAETQTAAVPSENEKPQTSFLPAGGELKGEDLTKQREQFEKELTEIENSALQAFGQWPERYVEELTALMDRFQRAGDYSGWETVREELFRFETDRIIYPRHFMTQLQGLLDIQRKYHQLRDTLRRAKSKQIIDATEKYVLSLQKHQKDLTVGGQMEAASMVQAEIKRVRSRLDFIEAQTLMAVPPSDTNTLNTVTTVLPTKS
jgi:tRNA A-37 threonylcarbamoyl transferase component Bud32